MKIKKEKIIDWLLNGDVSIRWQTMRDLTDESQKKGREFLLCHKLFRSHRTGEIVDPKITRLSFPPRWRYDIMRALDYFRECKAPTDRRMIDAIELIQKKKTRDGRWKLQNKHPGKAFFELEQVGQLSRWNTLRALRILSWWNKSR